jgi:glycosyltransferase involved in cell wall biosynthesis
VLTNRLVDSKRTDVAVRAAALAGVELDIIGSGPEEDQLRRLIQELGLEERVRLHGLGVRSQIQEALDAAGGFVLCSLPLIDGTPMAVLEAMSRARPVIAFPMEGILALIRDGVEGLHFDGSPESLAAALRRLSTEPGLATALGQAARGRWERDFVPAALARRYDAIYREVLGRDDQGRAPSDLGAGRRGSAISI